MTNINASIIDQRLLGNQEEIRQQAETDLGFNYRRKRMDKATSSIDITSGAAAEAILAVWRTAPHQAKFMTREHFGKLYDKIFTDDLNGAQIIVAVLLYRIAENHRRRPAETDPVLVRYASSFIAMLMGFYLSDDMRIQFEMSLDMRNIRNAFNSLDHRSFAEAMHLIEQKGESYYAAAVEDVDEGLKDLYGQQQSCRLRCFDYTNLKTSLSKSPPLG